MSSIIELYSMNISPVMIDWFYSNFSEDNAAGLFLSKYGSQTIVGYSSISYDKRLLELVFIDF